MKNLIPTSTFKEPNIKIRPPPNKDELEKEIYRILMNNLPPAQATLAINLVAAGDYRQKGSQVIIGENAFNIKLSK